MMYIWDRIHTQSPIKCNELHARFVHLSTSAGFAPMLQGFLHWQHSTAAALLLCYPTCQTKPGCLNQDPLCSCTGCREPCSPVQQVGHLYLLCALMFNRTRVGDTFPGTSFLRQYPCMPSASEHAFAWLSKWILILVIQKIRVFWSLIRKSQDILSNPIKFIFNTSVN